MSALAQKANCDQAHFLPVGGATHFSLLAPATQLIAQKILNDKGPGETNISIAASELSSLFSGGRAGALPAKSVPATPFGRALEEANAPDASTADPAK
jgi:hypothetical protein